MSKDFYIILKERRSFYGIGKETTISTEHIEEIIENALQYTPSAFNTPSSRIVLLFGEDHNKLWDITKKEFQEIVPLDQFPSVEEKINSFRNGYGTVLFFEDINVIEQLQRNYDLYHDNFPVWAHQASGMLQYIVWSSLEIEGLGASLQHYNPIIDREVKNHWRLPSNWKLIAQMPFGKPISVPDKREFTSINERLKVFKSY
ncbi:nitroreductase family protein [Clostridium cellulovorans]|uniref:Nitroreductase n=1 Tax=Clostridium cellulovorans (strain ATCC 35296 / DSM 3052 / OCM 3 / 743B) TaxID=573061 RepID=D9SR25_CLOC7|nr:nitroreductase family protein [Clostridium cellulovorans]ADL50313.1 nitroreductase [Clostridium cellulovorans 743B]